MDTLMIILCAVFFTYPVFLLAKFSFKKKEGQEYMSAEKIFGTDNKTEK